MIVLTLCVGYVGCLAFKPQTAAVPIPAEANQASRAHAYDGAMAASGKQPSDAAAGSKMA